MANAISGETHDPQGPAEWHDHIAKYGYVIVHNALPQEYLAATIDDIWRHTGASLNDPESWYRPDVIPPVGMVEMHHYQSMWNNRQHPNLYEIFRAIHGTDELEVFIDRVGLKPPVDPAHPDYVHRGMIHWDTDMTGYPDIPFYVQGVLALTDTEPDMGGFQCIPETYQELDEFLIDPVQRTDQVAQSRLRWLFHHPAQAGRRRSAGLDIAAAARQRAQHFRQATSVPVHPHEPGRPHHRADSPGAHRILAHKHGAPIISRRPQANRATASCPGRADRPG